MIGCVKERIYSEKGMNLVTRLDGLLNLVTSDFSVLLIK
jgi:hypothetical protein